MTPLHHLVGLMVEQTAQQGVLLHEQAASNKILSLKQQSAELTEKLKQKGDEMEGMEVDNTNLFIKERQSNEELQLIRRELIDASYRID